MGHAHNDALTASCCLQNPPDPPQCLSFPLPPPSPTWTSSPSSNCIPRNDSKALQNAILPELLRLPETILGKQVFIMKLTTSILLFLTCLNFKVTNDWKLPCNCTWVSQFHSFCWYGRIYANFFTKKNNHFQDKKDFTCKIQTIPVLGKDFPS